MTEHNNAVTFNRAAFKAWLHAPSTTGSPSYGDTVPALTVAYQRLDGQGGWLVEAVLDALRDVRPVDADFVAPWACGQGVGDVHVWTVADPEGGGTGGGLVGEVSVDGVTLSIGRLTENELVPGGDAVLASYEAAELALTVLAAEINEAATRFRRWTAATVREQGSDDDIVDAVIVEDGPAGSAYASAAAAADNDYNHPGHPAHW